MPKGFQGLKSTVEKEHDESNVLIALVSTQVLSVKHFCSYPTNFTKNGSPM
jgi:hypothetical protein